MSWEPMDMSDSRDLVRWQADSAKDKRIAELEGELAMLRLGFHRQTDDKDKLIAELEAFNGRLRDVLEELIDRLDEVQHLESKLFKAREVLKEK